MYKMCEKLKTDVSMKYLSPGTDILVDVADDDDVQVSHATDHMHGCTLLLSAWTPRMLLCSPAAGSADCTCYA